MRQPGCGSDVLHFPGAAGLQAGHSTSSVFGEKNTGAPCGFGACRTAITEAGTYARNGEIGEGDIVIFASGEHDQGPHWRSFDDSNERDDPAYWERLNRPMPLP